jgi:hypothetical protein
MHILHACLEHLIYKVIRHLSKVSTGLHHYMITALIQRPNAAPYRFPPRKLNAACSSCTWTSVNSKCGANMYPSLWTTARGCTPNRTHRDKLSGHTRVATPWEPCAHCAHGQGRENRWPIIKQCFAFFVTSRARDAASVMTISSRPITCRFSPVALRILSQRREDNLSRRQGRMRDGGVPWVK